MVVCVPLLSFFFLGDWVTKLIQVRISVFFTLPFHKITNFLSEALGMI